MHFLLCKSIALYFLKKATRDSFRDSFFAAQTKRIVVHICLFYWGISIQTNTKFIANTYIIHPKLYYNSIFSSSLQCLMAVILCLVSNNKNKKKTFFKNESLHYSVQSLISSSSATIISEFIEFRFSLQLHLPKLLIIAAAAVTQKPHLTVKPDLTFFGTIGIQRRGPLSMKILSNEQENLESKRERERQDNSQAVFLAQINY